MTRCKIPATLSRSSHAHLIEDEVVGVQVSCFWNQQSSQEPRPDCRRVTATENHIHYVNVSVIIKFSQKTSIFTLIHKIICFGCVLELPPWGDSNTHPKHMILWRIIENYPFLSFWFRPQISPIFIYVRWKSGVTFVRRCLHDAIEIGNVMN